MKTTGRLPLRAALMRARLAILALALHGAAAVTQEKLRALRYDFAQGYFLSKPLPETELVDWA
ncbi:phosphodiesterase [Pandoraea anapnoica]|uniref:Phosphodiesterase n=1 Tax=Pandoraea anapnoica TaxID=2508301 RepID=A0A5E4ZR79_9BURK|nr:hypothetical protein [Pandoraea anapnoica]VVE62773.1 phosphodiesterase [Pandoraea anapnoica]